MRLIEGALSRQGVMVATATTDDDGYGRRTPKPVGPIAEEGVVRWYFPKQTEFYKYSRPLSRWLTTAVSDFDIVHVHSLFSHAPVAAAYAARRHGTPYVIRPVGVLNHYGLTRRRALLKRLSIRWIEAPLLQAAAAVQFTTPLEQEQGELLGIPMHSRLVPLGVPLPEHSQDRRDTVVFVGRLDPVKNLEGLLAAWKTFADRHPQWSLLIAGSGPADYEARLKTRASDLNLFNQVTWLGDVRGDAKERLLSLAGIFLLPSFSENFGIAALEAMSYGAPTLLSEGVGLAAEATAAGACLCCSVEPPSIAEALCRLVQAPQMRTDLGDAAREFAARHYSIGAMGRRLVSLYEEILSGRHSEGVLQPCGRAVE